MSRRAVVADVSDMEKRNDKIRFFLFRKLLRFGSKKCLDDFVCAKKFLSTSAKDFESHVKVSFIKPRPDIVPPKTDNDLEEFYIRLDIWSVDISSVVSWYSRHFFEFSYVSSINDSEIVLKMLKTRGFEIDPEVLENLLVIFENKVFGWYSSRTTEYEKCLHREIYNAIKSTIRGLKKRSRM